MAGGLIGGLVGGKPSQSQQRGESGTDIGRGLAETDRFIAAYGAPLSLSNLAPGGTVQQPYLPYTPVGPQHGTATNSLPAPTQGGIALRPPAAAPGNIPPPGGAATANPTALGPNPAGPPGAIAPGAQQQQAPQQDLEKILMDALGLKGGDVKRLLQYLTPEQAQAIVNQQSIDALTQAEVPTAARTQDYGDEFRLPAPQATFGAGEMQAAQDLGYGGTPQSITPPQIGGNTPMVNGAQATAAQSQTSGPEFQQFSNDIYESQFRPVQRELSRQEEIGQRSLKAQLANAGLATSGTGIAQETELSRDFNQRLQDSSTDAANRASAQAFGLRQEQTLQNVANQQQVVLQNAGFDQQAQITNAGNVLTGNIEDSKNYLAAMGLDLQQAQQYRDFFLQIQGMRAADLERMDAGQRQNIEFAFNSWLQTFNAVQNTGRFSTGSAGAIGPSPIIQV